MADLPSGFVLDTPDVGLPPGFVLDDQGGEAQEQGIFEQVGQEFKDIYGAKQRGEIGTARATYQTVGKVGAPVVYEGIGKALEAGSKIVETVSPTIHKYAGKATSALTEGIMRLPTNDPRVPTVGDLINMGADKYKIWKKKNPNLARDVESTVNIVGLMPLVKGGSSTLGRVIKDKKKKKTPPIAAEEFKALSNKQYESAATTGATFPRNVSNDFLSEAEKLSPKPIAGKVLTKEDKAFIADIKEYSGIAERQLTLDDIKRLDESLTAKIDNRVNTQTGSVDNHGRKLINLQDKLRDISATTPDQPGLESLNKGKKLWAAQMRLSDLEKVVERAATTNNPATALQAGYRRLLMNKSRIRGYSPEEVELLRIAATPKISDDLLGRVGNRLNVIAAGATAGFGGIAAAEMIGIAGRGAKDVMVAGRGTKLSQAISGRALKEAEEIVSPTAPRISPLQLPSPEKIPSPAMTDVQVVIAKTKMRKGAERPDEPLISGTSIKSKPLPHQVPMKLLEGPKKSLLVYSNKVIREQTGIELTAAIESRRIYNDLSKSMGLSPGTLKASFQHNMRKRFESVWDEIDAKTKKEINSQILEAWRGHQKDLNMIVGKSLKRQKVLKKEIGESPALNVMEQAFSKSKGTK